MQRPIWRLGAALAVALGIVAACGGGDKPTEEEPELLLSATPRQINDRGQAAQLTITATNADGSAGTGDVTVVTPAGALGNSDTEEKLNLANGKATTSFTCDKTADAKCAGSVRIEATWGSTTGTVTVTVSSGSTGDGGTPDGGTGNPDGGSGSGDGGTTITVVSSKSSVFTSVGDFAEITATLTGSGNTPKVGESITFDTTVGGLQVSQSDTPAQSVQASTNSAGKAVVRLVESGPAGTASVRARHTASGAQASVSVKITNIQQITHSSTTCGGTPCTIMGTKSSGFNEQSQVSFKVVDSTSQPVPGVTVTFSIPNPPGGTTVSPSATTNAQGIATAIVSSGPSIGAIVVHAVAIAGRVEVDSPNIGIRGAKVANKGFSLACKTINIGVYTSPNPPALYTVACDVKVQDRYLNPVGTGTTVNFKVEAGNITNSVATKAYSPTGNNADEGKGSVNFSTEGALPVDVDPLEADDAQFPIKRDREPRGPKGQLTANPRDGLVTVLAYTRGEEWFDDGNTNGIRDPGEQFYDQGEPFVDNNDNGVRDPGETYIDEAPADGQWNGPNGVWDNDTSIWVETRILYTGKPTLDPTHTYILPNVFSGNCGDTNPPPLGKGETTTVRMYFGDDFFNRPQAQGTSFSATHKATKGSVKVASAGFQDGYGFGYVRELFSTSTGQACLTTSPICVYKVYFTSWGGGYVSDATITGAARTDTQSCQSDEATFSTTVLGTTTGAQTIGAIE
ncbi:Ig-like domain-containing protein [Hyalangium versicolor]|uniref:Ig-like domain-containing protein n=1 Tax=Hyalangium versicolor TaxID=2861190 RepID=UPI001CCBC5B3|nr:Ig-like domain-containing protein [Hyalangium versicolor]